MKTFCATILLLVAVVAPAFAQQFDVGIRAGANLADFSLPKVSFEEGSLSGGDLRVGFETALVARFTILRHLYMQTEFEYGHTRYQLRYESRQPLRLVTLQANRVELPLMLGLRFGPVAIFGGTFLRIAHNEKSSDPTLAKVQFNDSEVGVMGGLGVNIRKFFIEARVTGYPKTSVTAIVESNGISQKVDVGRNIRYSLSAGIFF